MRRHFITLITGGLSSPAVTIRDVAPGGRPGFLLKARKPTPEELRELTPGEPILRGGVRRSRRRAARRSRRRAGAAALLLLLLPACVPAGNAGMRMPGDAYDRRPFTEMRMEDGSWPKR